MALRATSMYAFGSGSGDAYRPGTPPASSSAASTSGSSGVASRFSIASFTSSSSSSSSSADRFNSPSSSTSSSGFPNVLKRASSSVYPSSLSAGGATAVQLPPSINILDRNLAKTRGGEVANAAWAFLFSEMVQYTQRRVAGIAEFEQRLSQIGYRVGQRLIELLPLRDSLPPSTSRNATAPPRQTRLLPVLHYVHTTLFKYLFGRPASSLERSTEHEDEYMVGDDEPVLDRGVNVPKEMSSLNTNALLAGLVEAVMDGLGFTSRVTAHLVPTEQHPRRTVLLIKLDKAVMVREKALASVK